MKTKIQLLLVLFFLTISTGFAQWVSLDKNLPPESRPVVQLISDDENGTVIKVDLPGFRINEFISGGNTYQSIDIGSSGLISETGMPEIPHIAKILAIPNQGSVTAEVLQVGKTKIINDINIPPARKSWIEGQPESPYVQDDAAYCSENLYPDQMVKVEDPVVFRDFRITRVAIFPIRYSPAKKQLEAVSSITVRIKYGEGVGVNPKLLPNKPISPSFARLYRSIIFNYEEVLQREYNGREEGYDLMLCIMPDSFATSFQTYADWNHKTGTYIHVTKFSEIGASGSNPVAVKNHILDAYNNWPVPPSYVLLVGDAGVAPVQYITLDGWTFTYDDYFVELAGNDYFPEMMIGRFTNQGDFRQRVMINKLMGYEKNPYITDPAWFRKGLVCSNDAYMSQIETKRFTRLEMLLRGNFTSVDTFYNDYPCPGNVTQIVNAINEGRGFVNYRGEGWYSGWGAYCFGLSTSNINNLANGAKLTFVTSIGCGVANFDNGSANNFGEAWMEIGDEFSPRGGCAFVGPVSNTHTNYNNEIDKGIYMGMFRAGLDNPGEALLRGKFLMYEVFGGGDFFVGYHYRIYHVLGDPSIHIWKDTPKNIDVSYTNSIGIGPGQIQVSVNYTGSGLPAEGALVCVSGSNVYSVGYTQTDGTVTIDVNPQEIGQLNFTVSGTNVIPFEGTIQVTNTNTFPLTVNIFDGWNMVSVPGINPDGQDVNNWWSGHTGDVFKFIPGSGYSAITTTTPGEGYWMKNAGDNVYNTGDEWPSGIQLAAHNPLSVAAQWNIIGGYEDVVDVNSLTTTPPDQIIYPIYAYIPGSGYQTASQIIPGYGYWIKLQSACQLIIPNTAMGGTPKKTEYFSKEWGRIIITDADGKIYTLYAADKNTDLSKYELPPMPPSGMFDIRFGSGRIAECLNNSQSILLSGVEYPLRVKVENMAVNLKDESGKQINNILNPGEELTVSNGAISKLIVSEEMIPDKFSLGQNYPNPFNSTTNIEYSIPFDGNVSISVYNTLGEKVADIINNYHKAGNYQVRFNPSTLSSGIYLYRMSSGNKSLVKKMMILK